MRVIAITGTGSLIGQAIIKSIKQSSFSKEKLIGIDYFIESVGSYWTDKNYILPDILDKKISEKYWLEKVTDIIKKEKVNILFIGVDFELPLFSKYKSFIENSTSCIIVVSDEKTICIGNDKYETYKFLKKNNLYHPKTFLETEILHAIKSQEIEFPIIVKPRNGYRSIDVYLVTNEEELLAKINKVTNPIIQEYIGNKDTEYTCGVISFNGHVKMSIVLRRDLKDGNTSTTYLENNFPHIIKEYVESVSQKLAQFGVCNFQLRIDDKGIPKIFEINARHSGTTYIRSLYGFNEIEYLLEYLLNKKEITFNMKNGTVKRYYDEFLVESNE